MKRIISIVILSTFLFNTAAADLALSQPMAPARGLDNLSTPSIFNPITGTPMAKDINFISGIVIEHLLPVMKYAAGQPITEERIRDILGKLDGKKLLGRSFFAPIQLFGHEVGTVTVDGKEMLHLMCRINQGDRKETYHAVFSPTATNIDELTLSVFRDDEFLRLFPDTSRARALKSLPARGQDDLDAIERDRLHQIYDRGVLDVVYADDSIPKHSFKELGLNFSGMVRDILTDANIAVDREHSPANLKDIDGRECTVVPLTKKVRELLEKNKVLVKLENGESQLVTAYAHSSNNSITLFIEPHLIRFLQSESKSNRLVALHAIKLLLAHEIGVSLGYQAIGFLNGAVSSLELCSEFDVRCANYNLYGKKSEPQTRPLVDLDTNPLTRDHALGTAGSPDPNAGLREELAKTHPKMGSEELEKLVTILRAFQQLSPLAQHIVKIMAITTPTGEGRETGDVAAVQFSADVAYDSAEIWHYWWFCRKVFNYEEVFIESPKGLADTSFTDALREIAEKGFLEIYGEVKGHKNIQPTEYLRIFINAFPIKIETPNLKQDDGYVRAVSGNVSYPNGDVEILIKHFAAEGTAQFELSPVEARAVSDKLSTYLTISSRSEQGNARDWLMAHANSAYQIGFAVQERIRRGVLTGPSEPSSLGANVSKQVRSLADYLSARGITAGSAKYSMLIGLLKELKKRVQPRDTTTGKFRHTPGGSQIDALMVFGLNPGTFVRPEGFSKKDHESAIQKQFPDDPPGDSTLQSDRQALIRAGYLSRIGPENTGQYRLTLQGLHAIGYALSHLSGRNIKRSAMRLTEKERNTILDTFERAAHTAGLSYDGQAWRDQDYALAISTGSSGFTFDVPLATAAASAAGANFKNLPCIGKYQETLAQTAACTVCRYQGEYEWLVILDNETGDPIAWSHATFHSIDWYNIEFIDNRYLVVPAYWKKTESERSGLRRAIFDLVECKRIDDPKNFDMQHSKKLRKGLYALQWEVTTGSRRRPSSSARYAVCLCDLKSGTTLNFSFVNKRPRVDFCDPFAIFVMDDDTFRCFNIKKRKSQDGKRGDPLWKHVHGNRDPDDSLTIDGKELTPAQKSNVYRAIEKAYDADAPADVRAETKETVRVNGDTGYTSTSDQDVELVVVPALAQCSYLIGHAGRGGNVMSHKKRRIYFSPERYEWYKSLEKTWPAAAKQFINHEIGHIDVKNALQGTGKELSEEDVQLLYPVNLVLAAEELAKKSPVDEHLCTTVQAFMEQATERGIFGSISVIFFNQVEVLVRKPDSMSEFNSRPPIYTSSISIHLMPINAHRIMLYFDGDSIKVSMGNWQDNIGTALKAVSLKTMECSPIFETLKEIAPVNAWSQVIAGKRQALRDQVFGSAEDAPAATTTTAADEGADDLLALATNAGLAIKTAPATGAMSAVVRLASALSEMALTDLPGSNRGLFSGTEGAEWLDKSNKLFSDEKALIDKIYYSLKSQDVVCTKKIDDDTELKVGDVVVWKKGRPGQGMQVFGIITGFSASGEIYMVTIERDCVGEPLTSKKLIMDDSAEIVTLENISTLAELIPEIENFLSKKMALVKRMNEAIASAGNGPASLLIADKGADDLLALAKNAGLAIKTDIGKRSTLLIDSAFYGSSAEEMESDQAVFGDRAYLNMVSGNTIENYIANIISKAQSDAQSDKIEDRDRSPERTIVLINRDRFVNEADQRAAFERLAKEAPGIKVLFTTKQALADMRASAEREALKKGTYCMMLAARQIDENTPADSPLITGLTVFLKAYAGLTDTATIGRAIDAMRAGLSAGQFWNTITGVINVTLSYRPSEPEAQKDATLFAEPMIRA